MDSAKMEINAQKLILKKNAEIENVTQRTVTKGILGLANINCKEASANLSQNVAILIDCQRCMKI